VIPAGGSGKLTAKIKTSPFRDRTYNKSIAVHTNVKGEEYLQLRLIAKSVAAISVKPRTYLVLNAVEGEASSARIYLHRNDGKALELSGVVDDLPIDLTVRVGEAPSAMEFEGASIDAGDLWVQLEIPADQPLFQGSGKLKLRTNHPLVDELQIPVRLYMKPMIEVRPSRVNIWIDPRRYPPNDTTVRIVHAQQLPFEVTGVEVSDPDIVSATPTTEGSRMYHVLRVGLVDGIDPEAFRSAVNGKITVHTTESRKSLIEIPLMVSVRGQHRRRTTGGGSLPTSTGTPTTGVTR
jgi:hypothetical protein